MTRTSILLLWMLTLSMGLAAQAPVDSAFYRTKQSQWLFERTGIWQVTMTLQTSSQAAPLVVNQIEAEREMIGALCLHEIMRPVKKSAMPVFERVSDLDFNLNDTHWDYISIDTRITAGIMSFLNISNAGDSLVFYIYNFPHPGYGPAMTDRGKNVRVKNVILIIDKDHEWIKQYWKLTDGPEWLAISYQYQRAVIK